MLSTTEDSRMEGAPLGAGHPLRHDLLLLLAAAIWGGGFVAQRAGMEALEPFTFNALRFGLGASSVATVIALLRRLGADRPEERQCFSLAATIRGGSLAGIALFAGAAFQQWGLVYTTAGKAAFITGLYVVIVQALAWLFGHKPSSQAGFGGMLALIGLYYLSVQEDFTLSRGDGLELIGSFFWACHVLVIGRVAAKNDVLSVSFVQFAVCTALNALFAVTTEHPSLEGVARAAVPLLYGGILSVGLAFTLQVFAQKRAHPGHAAVILSSEAAFGALYGWLFLGELLPPKALIGCGLMLTGIIVCQIPQIFGSLAPVLRPPPTRIGPGTDCLDSRGIEP